jgi:uncharacterized protein YecE (DUF72 family)
VASAPGVLQFRRNLWAEPSNAFIGTSGWNYKHWWNGVFYDKNVRPADWLAYFSTQFATVEINNSFYRLPSEESFRKWRSQVPGSFCFAVKASRYLTHIKRLRDPAEPLNLFFSRVRLLREHLGPVLFQLPPRFKCDLDRLVTFLSAIRKHSLGRKLRCVLEVRDPTWLTTSVYDALGNHNTALCFADWRDIPVNSPVTADFVYVRRHHGKAADGNYGRKELNNDVKAIKSWLKHGLDVYVYFNNDWKGYALDNARYCWRRLYADQERN